MIDCSYAVTAGVAVPLVEIVQVFGASKAPYGCDADESAIANFAFQCCKRMGSASTNNIEIRDFTARAEP